MKQLLHSNPELIVFSGRSAFKMFNDICGDKISPPIDISEDVYGLLTRTAESLHYFETEAEVNGENITIRSRIIISPHFSYDDNFVPHSRFSEEQMVDFKNTYPEAYTELDENDRVGKPNRDGFTGILVDDLADFQTRYPEATISLMRNFSEPSSIISKALKQEHVLGNIAINNKTGKLKRTDGSCNFCSNEKWQFPDGCQY